LVVEKARFDFVDIKVMRCNGVDQVGGKLDFTEGVECPGCTDMLLKLGLSVHELGEGPADVSAKPGDQAFEVEYVGFCGCRLRRVFPWLRVAVGGGVRDPSPFWHFHPEI